MKDKVFYILLTILCFSTFTLGAIKGYKAGQIAAANGYVKCKLVEQNNKTTEWECK